ncbi:MAG: DVUA0089 family protein [Hassallia sp. WJT32-NPBG1]|jgi:hypothetical protein|nr:DVUA0089 family protein [Hassallia sp. WJT32-NPBG1]
MKNFAWKTVIFALIAVLIPTQVKAVSFTQTKEVGETLTTAQVIPSGPLSLESISGTISQTNPANLFQIYLTGGKTFSATTKINPGSLADPQLFLFDSNGKGIYANDDESVNTKQATLPKGEFSPTNAGIYYLGISGFDYDPVGTKGKIFSDFPDVPFQTVLKPSGIADGFQLEEFDGLILDSGSYTITLTGVQSAKAIPEASSGLGLLAFGVLSTGAIASRRRQRGRTINGIS